jgi:outer membrane immunogenic protein
LVCQSPKIKNFLVSRSTRDLSRAGVSLKRRPVSASTEGLFMKYSISLGAVLALAAGAALAADLPSRKEAPAFVPPPPPPPLWTGFYAGLNLGGGWLANGSGNNSYLPYADPGFPILAANNGLNTPNLFFLPGGGTTGNNTGGVVGGGQAGYNYQFGTSFVVGVETDIQGTSLTGGNQGNYAGLYNSPFAGQPGSAGVLVPLATGNGGNVGLPWFGTVRGRVGWLATPTLLLYGTGGFAYAGLDAFQRSTTATGWTAGGGVEWLFLPNWSAKLEYLYVKASSLNTNNNGWLATAATNRGPGLNVLRLGVNYHFNFAPPAPVIAKY